MSLPDPDGVGRWRKATAWSGAVLLYFAGFGALLASGPLGLDAAQEARVLRWALAILGVFSASIWLLLMRTRQELEVIQELLEDVRFGPGTKRDRDAVDILVRALRTPDPSVRETALRTLRKISGQDLGEDPLVWEQWWVAARPTFSRGGGRPAGKGGPDDRKESR